MGNMEDREDYRREEQRRRKRLMKKKKRRAALIGKTVLFGVLLVLLLVCVFFAYKTLKKDNEPEKQTASDTSSDISGVAESTVIDSSVIADASIPEDTSSYYSEDRDSVIALATKLEKMYDYDGAVNVLNGYYKSAEDSEIQSMITRCNSEKAACVPVDVNNVPHVFFHSVMNDTRGLKAEVVGESKAKGNACWMITADELRTVLQQMYDYGCVLIRLSDIAVATENEDGTVTYSANNNLLLPQGKTAVIMSEDDLSYYHSYDGQGYATKMVLDENGVVKCEYTDENGNTSVGDYDVAPILASFIDEHPDFSYKNAHLTIAMTGYDGCFGYRTDAAYKTGENLTEDQSQWLAAHPDFNWDEEVAEATKIADALKKEGFDFASHTWGHLRAGSSSLDTLKADQERFKNTVVNIIGQTDKIIFAHGEDIGDWHDYSADNEKFAYYKSEGYNFYCNVDGSTPSWIQIRSNYVRTGRVDIDGYRLWQAMQGDEHSVADMAAVGIHDISSFFCPDRITPVELTG